MRRDEAMSALTPITLTSFTGLPGAGKSTRLKLKRLRHQPAQPRNFVEKAYARYWALEALKARP